MQNESRNLSLKLRMSIILVSDFITQTSKQELNKRHFSYHSQM